MRTNNFKVINGIKQAIAEKVKEYLHDLKTPPLGRNEDIPLDMDTTVDDVV